ncbi:hypothetical protein BKA83DRAFT_4559083 [Pisolithus microcarpus]|nr:hypothetical protein BKA83DRAFT_4559083 [Pisolithus microcarpus]
MPKVANLAPRLSIRRKTSTGHAQADSIVERMAQRNAQYLRMFNQHADLVRGKEASEVTNAYHRVISKGIMSDSDLDAMEHVLCSPTATLDDYVLVGLTAHSLLLLQMETMKKLPHDVMVKVDARTIELRSQMRDRDPVFQQDRCALLAPPTALPKLERPPVTRHVSLSKTAVHNMLASPSTLVGKQFILRDMSVHYCITSVTVTLTECTFSLQYEDIRGWGMQTKRATMAEGWPTVATEVQERASGSARALPPCTSPALGFRRYRRVGTKPTNFRGGRSRTAEG